MVPHLVTGLNGPINELEQRILDSTPSIERWFRLEWMEHTPTFYSAVDVRNAGYKLAPVDTDLFPEGWNSLTPSMLPLAVQAAMAAIEKICPEARNLLIVPRNQIPSAAYLASLSQLRQIFHMAGLNVRLGSISPDLKKPQALTLPDGESLTLEPVVRVKGRVMVKDFDPCTILLNNDLSAGVPGILEDLHLQYLLPPFHAGWSLRRRSNHLKCLEEVSKRFGKLIGVDHWLLAPLHDKCAQVDFASEAGVQELVQRVDTLLAKIRKKHKEYGIKEKPFVVVKADNADPALAATLVRDTKDLLTQRAAMVQALPPKRSAVFDVVLQEGVPASERVNDAVAEPVVYTMDRYVVGGFYRVHAGIPQGQAQSGFVPLAFADSAQLPQPGAKPGASVPNRFYMYGVVGRLAMLAASYDLEATDPQAERYN